MATDIDRNEVQKMLAAGAQLVDKKQRTPRALVTTSDGVLIGLLRLEDADGMFDTGRGLTCGT